MYDMSKKTIISTVLAMLLIFVGAGYAYWTDNLNVGTTMTTGDLDVTFVDLGLYAQYGADELVAGKDAWTIIDGIGNGGYLEDNAFRRDTSNYNIIAAPGTIDAYNDRASGYNNVKFDAILLDAGIVTPSAGVPYTSANALGSDTILIEVANMYPGYAQAFRSDILNVGSLAALLSKIKFDVDGPAVASDMLGVAILMEREWHDSSQPITPVFKLANTLLANGDIAASDIFTLGGVDFVRLSALADLKIADVTNNLLLADPSANAMDIFLAVAMDPDADGVYTTGSTDVMAKNDDTASQNGTAKFTIQLLWDQFNVGLGNDAPANILERQNVGLN